jgi:TonB-dependent receptor
VGQRFGARKQLGVLIGGTYDWNGRGINDIEPSPTITSLTPHYDSMDIRDYMYYRTRWGLAGSADYKLNEGSDIHLRGLYSTFKNWGHKWVYTLNDNDNPQASQDWRRPDFAIGSLVLGGRHLFQTSWLNWDVSVARSRSLNGSGGASYNWVGNDFGGNNTCLNIPNPQTQFRPLFSPACFAPGATDATDIRNYTLRSFRLPPSGISAQLNLQATASYAKQYHLGSHYGTFEFGGKIRNAHKFDDTTQLSTGNITALAIPAAQFLGSFTDPNYYDKTYHITNTPDYTLVRSFVMTHGLLSSSPGADFDLIERVTAGYLMNTIDLTHRLRLATGVRFEATHLDTLLTGSGDYLDVLPSASLRIGVTNDSALRVVYSRGLSRPDPQDIAQPASPLDNTQTPNVISIGNPGLKAEHSDNFDLLYEQYLKPVGMFQAGFFYKRLTDPIVNGQFQESPSLFPGATSPFVLVSEVQNAGSAHVLGFEIAYQQRLRFLPGVLKGAGISANYSRTASQADGLNGLFRTDHPALLRQAPNTWNISPTFDTKRFSMRVGMTYNDAMIFVYQFQNLQVDPLRGVIPLLPCTTPGPICDGAPGDQQTAGGAKGPFGDQYLYSHFQLDVQGSYKITRNFTFYAYGLNLNNEVFGFYNGSPQYVVQREYYHPTYAGGIRWTSGGESSR